LEKGDRIIGLTGSVIEELDSPTLRSNLHSSVCAIFGIKECQLYLERIFSYNGEACHLKVNSGWNRVGKKLLVGICANGIRAAITDASLSGTSDMPTFHFSISKPEETYKITNEVKAATGSIFTFPIQFGSQSASIFVPNQESRPPDGSEFLLYEIYSLELRSINHCYQLKFNNDYKYQDVVKQISNCCSLFKTVISFLSCTHSMDDYPPVTTIGDDITALATLKDQLLELERIIDGNSAIEKVEEEEKKERLEEGRAEDTIVNFNVMGDIVTVPKSAIDKYLPDSQLPIRVSGRWEAQPGEIDSQGNLIIIQPKEPLMKLFSYLRLENIERINNLVVSPMTTKVVSFQEYLSLDKDVVRGGKCVRLSESELEINSLTPVNSSSCCILHQIACLLFQFLVFVSFPLHRKRIRYHSVIPRKEV
jgi:hypothetical protein